MAKYEVKFDLQGAKRNLARYKALYESYLSSNPSFEKIIKQLEAVPKLSVLIFSKSIAFRIGRSSIKSVPGFSAGFKDSFQNLESDVGRILDDFKRTSRVTALPKNKTVILAAGYFILFHPDRVKLEEDKTEAAESEQVMRTVQELQKLLKDRENITIHLGKESYLVDGFRQVMGRPKADAVFLYKNTPVIFCSLKKGSRPADFQQYGGWSDLGLTDRNAISRLPEADNFVARIENIFNSLGLVKDGNNRYNFNDVKKGTNFASYIDNNLANKSIFGKNFGTKNWGLDNCQIVIDGDIVLAPHKDGYTLDGTFYSKINPLLADVKTEVKDEYRPAFFIYKSEHQGLNQGGFSNARASIWPNNAVIKNYVKKLNDVEAAIRKGGSELDRIKKEILK